MVPEPLPLHSKPVVIPPRTPTKCSISTQTVRARGQNGGRRPRIPNDHKPNAIPPAVAALLAVTSIPPPANRRRKGNTVGRRISIDELIQEWRQEDHEGGHAGYNSPLDLLLERPDECEADEVGSVGSNEQEKGFLASRSVSSESIPSMPSLEPDERSVDSSWSNPSTPLSLGRRLGPERKEKIVQSPPKEDCILDHPLLYFSTDDLEDGSSESAPDIEKAPQNNSLVFKSFKSNLTASIQALKSAAKSFSNFTAPSVPPDDLLTRSLLSPRFTSEMRPKPLHGIPTPALRRYLNPQPTPISPTELSMQLHEALQPDFDSNSSTPMIQMQTYDRRSRTSKSKRRTNSAPHTEAGRALTPAPAVRQREPRENSDFLRVIVLEMNMRREGKLDAKALGKARIWLPPRKTSGRGEAELEGGVPSRWVGILVDDQ
ncbi:hypothetical protein K432DRAFT_302099 [Lepidopterella palustris CBS 459.81]|uniref:Uncharacterized protein n=1 Tax=Lepidopterella palustris CBS 459.81 TaxID=1314670 RepID=A0A8E2JDH6_9PEZI|nr:hypothetical protein K432DRAFT_302099 [Lepidopterella palustris CBS 459.81]